MRKHADASEVTITLSYMDRTVVWDVQDDGKGFELERVDGSVSSAVSSGFGLAGLRQRAKQLGGTVLVESVPGQGTTLVVQIPIAPESPDRGRAHVTSHSATV